MIEDPRKTGLKNGLRQLTIEQLERVLEYPGEMVLDTFNYEDGKFCPLAVALELDKTMENPTHEKVFGELTNRGYKVYNTRGIDGEFYTTNRLEDLVEAAKEVLHEKKVKDAQEFWDEFEMLKKMRSPTLLTRYGKKRNNEEFLAKEEGRQERETSCGAA